MQNLFGKNSKPRRESNTSPDQSYGEEYRHWYSNKRMPFTELFNNLREIASVRMQREERTSKYSRVSEES